MGKPSEIIKEKIEKKGGKITSRQIKAILEFLDEEHLVMFSPLYCMWCGKKVKLSDFNEIVSVREFKISGLCSFCQDKMFDEKR